MQLRPLLFVVLAAFTVACGGGGRSGNPNPVDAPDDEDDDPTPDAPPVSSGGIGDTCTPDQANPQGDCPAGFVCLQLQNGTNPWCSKACTPGAGDQCAAGYTGTGRAQCIYQVTPPGGGPAQTVCGVICDDQTQGEMICPASECDGTCPGTLACSAPLTTQQGMTVALGCI